MRRSSLAKFLVAGLAAAALAFGATLSSAAPTVVSSGPVNLVIPETAGSSLENEILDVDLGDGFENAKVTDVNLHLRIDHTADQDLEVSLIHDGVTVQVSRDNGEDGDDYGTGADCGGTFTVLDDEATNLISAGTAPFTGSFKPDNPLSSFDGKLAEGDWKLRVVDDADNTETGTLVCWRLEITVAVADLEVTVTDTPDPTAVGNELAYKATVKNLGPDKAVATKLTVKLPTGAEFVSDTPDVCDAPENGEVECNLGDLDSGASSVVDLVVKPGTAGTNSAFFTAASDATDTAAANSNQVKVDTLVQADGSGGDQTITVETLGQGRGTVTSDPAGINCGTDCEGGFLAGTKVKLTATPAADSVFVAWGGACDGMPIDATCEVTAEGAKNVTAQFDKSGNGGGGNGGGGNNGGGGVFDICTITGTAGKDTLRGTAGKDVICGLAGADTIYGLGGADRIYGGPGKDKLYGGKGNDTLFSSDKFADKLWGGKGKDKARGDVRDTMTGVEGFF
jgi:uncharacterized repeat protein (TIGR01451 family)